ncbi:AarF/ABC1/UbiB kinase family protein [Limnobacter humi]|uniref:AarF/ABC1/UbiB kinase family protein n=1 Tax=Limnobacter humi TaxID=1778671 RepID=A0ABT1WDG2_9BURK|nr:AarF/ABC1/UbiB kinase family protein [Limnobacter humi]MCQ8895564.1 AarF/ABC1/UbiB kinase family protein [Limnobacter humi]
MMQLGAFDQAQQIVMGKSSNAGDGKAVPSGRLARLSKFGALATTVAGSVVKNGTKQLVQGKRPKLSDLLLTPKNAMRVANQLAQLRGAAMKLGQLISMDAGDILPPQLADILARLRSDAHHMPKAQLYQMLSQEWGDNWQSRVARFDENPVAAASIGQVHRAISLDGQPLAVKIQYPGVRESIDSDIDNVASILRFTGLVPDTLDIRELLQEAKKQLHEEADYQREADCLEQFRMAMGDWPHCAIPGIHRDLSTRRILAMDFVEGEPIESLTTAPQSVRDGVLSTLFTLMFCELFHMRLMQTDPNFANYLARPTTQTVVLLDFGATRPFTPELVAGYQAVVAAALAGSRPGLEAAALQIGYFDDTTQRHHRELVLDLMELACEPLCSAEAYDFGQANLAERLRDKGLRLAEDWQFWHTPPVDCLFLHRKMGGLFLLATRLKARVNIQRCLQTAAGVNAP